MLNRNIKVDLHIHSKASEYKEADGYVDESNIENIDVLLFLRQMTGELMVHLWRYKKTILI